MRPIFTNLGDYMKFKHPQLSTGVPVLLMQFILQRRILNHAQ